MNSDIIFTSYDGLFDVRVSRVVDPLRSLPDGFDVIATMGTCNVGSILFERAEDLVMFADCLSEYINDRGIRKETGHGR